MEKKDNDLNDYLELGLCGERKVEKKESEEIEEINNLITKINEKIKNENFDCSGNRGYAETHMRKLTKEWENFQKKGTTKRKNFLEYDFEKKKYSMKSITAHSEILSCIVELEKDPTKLEKIFLALSLYNDLFMQIYDHVEKHTKKRV